MAEGTGLDSSIKQLRTLSHNELALHFGRATRALKARTFTDYGDENGVLRFGTHVRVAYAGALVIREQIQASDNPDAARRGFGIDEDVSVILWRLGTDVHAPEDVLNDWNIRQSEIQAQGGKIPSAPAQTAPADAEEPKKRRVFVAGAPAAASEGSAATPVTADKKPGLLGKIFKKDE